ncbi:unnamed protein product [Closterium sp. Naga37s-1]|nr:unnamed protein product [Closterium sp. Naga37s-1]
MVLFQNVGGSVTFLLQIALLAWGIRQLRSVLAKRRETRQRNQGSSAGASPAFASLSPLAALMMAGWTGESGGASGGAGAGGAGSSSAGGAGMGAGASTPSHTAAGNGAGGVAGEIGAGRIGAGGEDGGVAEAGGVTPRAAAVGGAEAGAASGGEGGWGGRNAVVVPHVVIDVRARDLAKSQPIPLPSPHVLNIPGQSVSGPSVHPCNIMTCLLLLLHCPTPLLPFSPRSATPHLHVLRPVLLLVHPFTPHSPFPPLPSPPSPPSYFQRATCYRRCSCQQRHGSTFFTKTLESRCSCQQQPGNTASTTPCEASQNSPLPALPSPVFPHHPSPPPPPESDLLQALQLPAAAWEHRFHDTRQPDRRHLLLFLSSHGNSAQRAATVAASLGYTRSCVLSGGLDALKKFLAASAAAGAPAPSPSGGGLGGGGGGGGAGGGGVGDAGLATTPLAHSHSSAAAAAAAAVAALGSSSSALSTVPSASAAAAPFHWIPSTAVSVKNISRDAVALLLARKGGQYPHTLILQSRPAPPSAAPLPPLASSSVAAGGGGAGVGGGEERGVREEGGERRENGVAEGLEAREYAGTDGEGRGADGQGGGEGGGRAGGEGDGGSGAGGNRGDEDGGVVEGRGEAGRERDGERDGRGGEAEGNGTGAEAQGGGGVGRVVWEEVGGGKPWFYLVDVRRFDERVLYGGIPGSVHIPAEVWPVALSLGEEAWKQRYQWPKMEPHSLLILHSNTGPRAYWAAQVARDAGYNRCFVMREGTHGWRLHPSVCVYDDYLEGGVPPAPQSFAVEAVDEGMAEQQLRLLGIAL